MTIALRRVNSGPGREQQAVAPFHAEPSHVERLPPARRRGRPSSARPPRASRVLRDLLAANAGVETFTLQRIIASLGTSDAGSSLMLFSVPALTSIPGTHPMVGVPTIAISGDLVAGRSSMRFPQQLLEQTVPRRSLALAVHAILPVLERMERLTRKRWSWLCSPAAHRAIGILVFLLALPLTFPFLGFGLPHAASLFTIALGMIERDGLMVALGVVAGIAALVFVTGRQLSPKVLAQKLAIMMKSFTQQMTVVRKVATVVWRRTWRWICVKLLSGPPASAKQARNGTHVDGQVAPMLPRRLAGSRQPAPQLNPAWRVRTAA